MIDGNLKAQKIINDYWESFYGRKPTWNFSFSRLRNQKEDTWVKNDWVYAAKKCMRLGVSQLSALEILVAHNKAEYIEEVERIINDWYEYSRHDPEYYIKLTRNQTSITRNQTSIK